MRPVEQFQISIVASSSLVSIYKEARRVRGLGARGRLNTINLDLLWLPRSAIVASISALDAYVHHVIYDRLPKVVKWPTPPNILCEQLANVMPIKNAAQFKEALPLLLAHDTMDKLIAVLKDKSLRFQAFQAPEKVEEAYKLIGHNHIFDDVSRLWQGPRSSARELKGKLNGYYRRRNQIAHEGDLESNGQPRTIRPEYAYDCSQFISSLVERLDRAVYDILTEAFD
jgi:hypothetical protein